MIETEVKNNINHLSKLGNSFLIEKMIKNKVAEIIIGIKIDDQFGPLIVIGSGGIYTELINDSVTLLLPLTKQIVLDAINNLRISKLLYGYRGKEEGDINALVETVLKLGKFVEKNASNLVEADINPLIICNKGNTDPMLHHPMMLV